MGRPGSPSQGERELSAAFPGVRLFGIRGARGGSIRSELAPGAEVALLLEGGRAVAATIVELEMGADGVERVLFRPWGHTASSLCPVSEVLAVSVISASWEVTRAIGARQRGRSFEGEQA
jgi:hypothetical protein